jgi:hypothetical protein
VPEIESQIVPGDAIVFIGIDQPPPPYLLYMKKDVPIISTYTHDLKDFNDFDSIASYLRPTLQPYRRVWFSKFLEWQKDSGHRIRDVVDEQFDYVKTIGFFKVEFDLYERK